MSSQLDAHRRAARSQLITLLAARLVAEALAEQQQEPKKEHHHGPLRDRRGDARDGC
jgi:hypothetical protein